MPKKVPHRVNRAAPHPVLGMSCPLAQMKLVGTVPYGQISTPPIGTKPGVTPAMVMAGTSTLVALAVILFTPANATPSWLAAGRHRPVPVSPARTTAGAATVRSEERRV